MKRIVICCDGTWNRDDDKFPTNVVKLRNAVNTATPKTPQQWIYDRGVGAEGSWLRRVWEGATGAGLSKNIRDVYGQLADVYEPGDALYLVGFSRGAFTVRSLAGMLRNCGVVKGAHNPAAMVHKAFALYKSRDEKDHPSGEAARVFRQRFSVPVESDNGDPHVPDIEFIGVFDTVGALGNPLWTNAPSSKWNKFHDTSLSSIVKHGCHAVAIDEKRWNFRECLWDQRVSNEGTQKLDQVWFPGVHADVGGGYEDSTYSDVALAWMMHKAHGCGLEFTKLPPRSRLDALVGKPHHESWKSFYAKLPRYLRPVRLARTTKDAIHGTAKAKFEKDADYRPPNLISPLD